MTGINTSVYIEATVVIINLVGEKARLRTFIYIVASGEVCMDYL